LSSPDGKPIVLGRVSGFRGLAGELTVKVVSGDAARWSRLSQVVLRGAGDGGPAGERKVEAARAYRDRLVLKLAGIDDANAAARLKGCEVLAEGGDVPPLPADVYWVERLVGAQVTDGVSGNVGRVVDVVATGGTDLLRVVDEAGVETLVPLTGAFVKRVDEAAGRIDVALPAGLRGLNEPGARESA